MCDCWTGCSDCSCASLSVWLIGHSNANPPPLLTAGFLNKGTLQCHKDPELFPHRASVCVHSCGDLWRFFRLLSITGFQSQTPWVCTKPSNLVLEVSWEVSVNDADCDVLLTLCLCFLWLCHTLSHLHTLYSVELTLLLHGSEFVRIVMWT